MNSKIGYENYRNRNSVDAFEYLNATRMRSKWKYISFSKEFLIKSRRHILSQERINTFKAHTVVRCLTAGVWNKLHFREIQVEVANCKVYNIIYTVILYLAAFTQIQTKSNWFHSLDVNTCLNFNNYQQKLKR